ncbi:MAG: NYN domain-containing protein [Anaerolinea sp.]|nr:NYN domain-containing protein [Anaerolinea sp.]
MTRTMVFIDGSNLYHSLRERYGRTDIDFAKLCNYLANGRELVRGYYYNATVDQGREEARYGDQQRFFDRLRRVPKLEVRLGTLVYPQAWPQAPPYEKGIDVRVATDMLTHAFRGNYDVAILVSGDNDFADALQAVKDLGRNVEVALFGNANSSRRLRDVADDTISLEPPGLASCWL